MVKTRNTLLKKLKHFIKSNTIKYFHIDIEGWKVQKLQRFNYDEIWERILSIPVISNKQIPGAFVDWDNTARKKRRGYIIENASPEKFKMYFSKQIKNTKENYKKDYIFLFAWNEWAESGYLEPDEKYKYKYLEALREALIENGEFNI